MDNNPLSDRECEILRLVSQGKSNKQIAADLFISVNTVKVHLSNIFQKIQVSSRIEATLYAIEHGICSPIPGFNSTERLLSTGVTERDHAIKQKGITGSQIFLLILAALILVSVGFLFITRGTEPQENGMLSELNNNRWVSLPDLPYSTSYAAATTYNSQIFLIGGVTDRDASAKVLMYNFQTEQWKDLTDKPTSVSNVKAVVLSEKIYVPGGITTGGKTTSVLEVYDPRNNTWSTLASLPAPLSDYALEVFEGKLYLFGGHNQSLYSDKVFSYDPVLDEWSEQSSLTDKRAYFDSAQWGGKIYLAGGFNGTERLNLVESYVPSRGGLGENPVNQEPFLPDPAYDCRAEQLVDTFFVICPNNITKLSPNGNYWIHETVPSDFLLGPGFASANFNNSLYVMGGINLEEQSTPFFGKFQALYSIMLPILTNE